MIAFIGRSLVQKIITLFCVAVVSFLIIHLAPGEPSQIDPLKPKFTPPRPGDISHTLADISKVKQLLGLKIEVDFETGLRKTLEWFKLSEKR